MSRLLRSRESRTIDGQISTVAWLNPALAIGASFITGFTATVVLLRLPLLQLALAAPEPAPPAIADQLPDSPAPKPAAFEFTLTAFGDSGWARSHQRLTRYQQGFRRAYRQFDPKQQMLGDLNYINWETSVGVQCDQFWAPPSDQTFAFVSHPQELKDAIQLGFNLIGLANNHSFDCLRSPEGQGPKQTLKHLQKLQQSTTQPLVFSGIRSARNSQPTARRLALPQGHVPVLFISAYVGGDSNYCQLVICAHQLPRYQALFKQHRGLRVLALHSWDPASHQQLKRLLKRSLQQGLIDVGLGSGPHIAEAVEIVETPRGRGLYASSLGNFIHPSLIKQPYNLVLSSRWSYQPEQQQATLQSVTAFNVSCTPGACRSRDQELLWSRKSTSDR